MEGFYYNNIFETKGIEYLVIIGFFMILIPFWIILNKQVKLKGRFQKTIGSLTARLLRIPQGLFYCSNHTWAHLESSGDAKVGIDDFLAHIAGEVTITYTRKPGDRVFKGDLLARLDNNGRILNVFSPISGEISYTNRIVNDTVGLINEDPYRKGWMYKIKPENWKAETASYHLAGEATVWFERELARFKDFLSRSMTGLSPHTSSMVLQDGGELADHPLSSLPEKIWRDFENDFLANPGR